MLANEFKSYLKIVTYKLPTPVNNYSSAFKGVKRNFWVFRIGTLKANPQSQN